MVKDHTQANEELSKIISQKGATLPTEATAASTREMDHMKNLSGAEFDRAYVKHMAKDHKEAVKEFEKAAKDAKDPDIKAFAAKTLPTLQQHETTLQGLERTVKEEKKAQ
jgi:putative membrane protein